MATKVVDQNLSAICKAIGATVNKTQAVADLLAQRWPDQSKVTGPDYRAVTDAASAAWVKAGGKEGSFRFAWSTCMAAAGLLPVKKDGTPIQRKGKTGATQHKAKAGAKPAAPAKLPISKEQAIRALFGAYDPELLAAVEYAAAHTVTFTAWATASAAAAQKPAVRRIKKDGTVAEPEVKAA